MNLKHVRKPILKGLLSLSMMLSLTIPTMAAPLYKDTVSMAGLFPWASNLQQSITRTKTLGFSRARMDFLWHWVEKKPGVYNFSTYDQIYNNLTASGIKPVFILAYNNSLYSGSSNTMIGVTTQKNRDAYANFVKASVAHFKGKGVTWEVWNEPDISNFWANGPSATAYAALAQSAITAIRQADPGAYVVTAGFAHKYWDREFIRQAMQAGMLRGYNAMAVHSYDYLNPPMIIESQEDLHNQLRQWMSQYNGGKVLPIIDTEFGARISWQKKVSSNPTDYAAKQTIRMNLDNYYSGVYMSSVYGMNAPDELNLFKDSAVTQALAYTNKMLANFEGTNLNYGAKKRGILFKNASTGQQIVAYWPSEGNQTVTFPAPLKVKAVYNVYGQQRSGAATLANLSSSVSEGPLFILLN